MKIADYISTTLKKKDYYFGSLMARLLLQEFGKNNLVSLKVTYYQPSKVCVGNGVEIREHSTIDGRSESENGIIIGDGSRIKENVSIVCYGGEIKLSNNVLIGRNSVLFGHGNITIGKKTMISPSCNIIASNHFFSLNGKPFQDQGFTRQKIIIGDNVWVGTGCSILGGAIIGDDIVVAAGSVVNKSVLESGYLYGGVPAVKLRKLEEEEFIGERRFFKNWNSYTIDG